MLLSKSATGLKTNTKGFLETQKWERRKRRKRSCLPHFNIYKQKKPKKGGKMWKGNEAHHLTSTQEEEMYSPALVMHCVYIWRWAAVQKQCISSVSGWDAQALPGCRSNLQKLPTTTSHSHSVRKADRLKKCSRTLLSLPHQVNSRCCCCCQMLDMREG